jgi:hypothetical protein
VLFRVLRGQFLERLPGAVCQNENCWKIIEDTYYTLQEKDLPQISRITRITRITAFICVIGGICGENSFS